MNVIKNILKTIAAGVVAVGILSVIFSFYYLQPAHIDNVRGNTDYVWISGARWVKMTEGLSWGRFDADGYNNPEVVENPDIIVLGSSHTEATNVVQGKEFASLLRDKLDGEYTVYNMGISGHNFLKVCQYLPQNLALYSPAPKAVVIETATLTFTAQEIDTMLQGKIAKSPSYSTGVIALSQKSPFFATLYHQVQGGLIDLLMPDKEKILGIFRTDSLLPPLNTFAPSTPEMSEDEAQKQAYEKLFAYLGGLQQQYGTQIIIVHHPLTNVHFEGRIEFVNEDITALFSQLCQDNRIVFVNLLDRFYAMHQNEHKLPHGFVTGKIGFGHLNADGHAVIADELHSAIVQLGKEGRL